MSINSKEMDISMKTMSQSKRFHPARESGFLFVLFNKGRQITQAKPELDACGGGSLQSFFSFVSCPRVRRTNGTCSSCKGLSFRCRAGSDHLPPKRDKTVAAVLEEGHKDLPFRKNSLGVAHRPCDSNETANMLGPLKKQSCSDTATLKNPHNTSPSVFVEMMAMFGSPLTLLNNPSSVNSSTVLSKTTFALVFSVHC